MSDSDIEIKKIAPMKPVKKPPTSPTEDILKHEKKTSTKTMIHQALTELKTRKGVSSYAIKKYLEEKYSIETEKVKYLIKKTLKTGVENGSIIQVKGIGASGSFKLAVVKEKPKTKPKKDKSKEKPTKEKTVKDKPKKEKLEKTGKLKEKAKKVKIDADKEKVKKSEKTEKPMRKVEKEKKGKVKEVKEKAKGGKTSATPAKKRANMMKRKSIGSIIKPPKMKPKSKA